MSQSVFITATGTDVGKTFVTALLLKKLRENGINAGYYKAALSGAEMRDGKLISGDAAYVCDIAGIEGDPSSFVSYNYTTAVSPHLAASLAGNPVEASVIEAAFQNAITKYDYVCMEGSGGIVCPLRMDDGKRLMLVDIVRLLHLRVLVVAPAQLGTINSTVLTIEYLRARNIPIQGIILNLYDGENFMHVDNKKQLEVLTGIPVIATVGMGDRDLEMDLQQLMDIFQEG